MLLREARHHREDLTPLEALRLDFLCVRHSHLTYRRAYPPLPGLARAQGIGWYLHDKNRYRPSRTSRRRRRSRAPHSYRYSRCQTRHQLRPGRGRRLHAMAIAVEMSPCRCGVKAGDRLHETAQVIRASAFPAARVPAGHERGPGVLAQAFAASSSRAAARARPAPRAASVPPRPRRPRRARSSTGELEPESPAASAAVTARPAASPCARSHVLPTRSSRISRVGFRAAAAPCASAASPPSGAPFGHARGRHRPAARAAMPARLRA